jgi:hypothetical protein
MLPPLVAAAFLMAVCVAIHAGGTTALLNSLRRSATPSTAFWPSTSLFVMVAAWLIVLHLSEVAVWALFYLWQDAMPDLQAALYFSAVTYTTTGYGDLTLPEGWRIVGGIEALTGILMCGWSTAFFFAVVNRLYEAKASSG